ncbi:MULTISPECIES: Lnb N-terminal periplasmic domain-containing protein [unclassified Pseudomonas]|uniref:Lnb N-terminal periplasmic domain-containing protein n=1 Tax=unclassified Pseudomonas TaxID=196821 RepID=UPI0039B72B4C
MLKRLAWLALCVCAPLSAAPHIDPQRLQQLANDRFWISLGHYETAKLGGWRSYISDKKFFLAPDGNEHPDRELAATLDALYDPANAGQQHAQCVYPARTRWLKAQLNLTNLPTVDCSDFTQWFKDVSPHSAVMIFPAAYLNSPSSMFGHTLLRIDQADVQSDKTALLSYAINFGAYIEGSDNSILYAWKGLMGGYPGLFALVPYQEKLSEYRSLENRDLWEYRLNLSQAETERMVEHVWELKQIQFDYFFFDENCSYRLLELLQVARPSLRLTEQFPLTAIPTDTVKAVKEAGLVESIQYRPSRERELLSRAEPLSDDEQQWVLNVSADQQQLQTPAFKALPRARQALIIDAAYRLERYRANGQERDPQRAQRSFELLRAINQNPAPELDIPQPGLPEDGHESRTWQAGLGTRGDRTFGEYGLRMAYHDLNDNAESFPLGAQIEILQLKLRQYEGNDWQVQQLDLATIRSLTPRNELLQPLSWQVTGGLERVPGKHDDETLVSHVNGGAGGTWALGDEVLGFALGTVRVEHNNDFAQFIAPAAGFNSGVLWKNPLGNLSLEAKGDYFVNGEVRRSLSLNQQWELSRNLGLRLSAQREFSQLASPENEVMLEVKWYHY